MQTETPLYVTDVLGEIDNPETAVIEPAPVRQAPRRGPALFVADRMAAKRNGKEHGSFIEWLALAVLAGVIIAALAASGIGTTISSDVKKIITDIMGQKDSGAVDVTKFTDKKNCENGGGKWVEKTDKAKAHCAAQ